MKYNKYAVFVAPAILKDGILYQNGLGHIEIFRGFYVNYPQKKRIGIQPMIGADGFVVDFYGGLQHFKELKITAEQEKWYQQGFEEAFGIRIEPFETYKITYQLQEIKGKTMVTMKKIKTSFDKEIISVENLNGDKMK